MPQLTIRRTRRFVDSLRSYSIELDGEPIGELDNGEQFKTEIDPGSHSLQARIDWCSSPSINVDAEEGNEITVEVEVPRSTLVHALLTLLYISIWRGEYLGISRVD